MKLQGKKIGILIEGDYYEPEIWYYKHRFAEEGIDLHFLTRMWGQTSEALVPNFKGHEYKIPFDGRVESFEGMDDTTLKSYAAIIVPSGMVSDRLRYTEDVNKIAPATEFIKRAFAEKSILKGILCHGNVDHAGRRVHAETAGARGDGRDQEHEPVGGEGARAPTSQSVS